MSFMLFQSTWLNDPKLTRRCRSSISGNHKVFECVGTWGRYSVDPVEPIDPVVEEKATAVVVVIVVVVDPLDPVEPS